MRAEARYNSMRLIIARVFAFSGVAFAANVAPVTYHDGTLVLFSVPASETSALTAQNSPVATFTRRNMWLSRRGFSMP